MKLNMIRLMTCLLVGVIFFGFFGCAGIQRQPQVSVCEKPEAENSLICIMTTQMGTTPEQVDYILQLSAAILADANPGEVKAAQLYINGALKLTEKDGLKYNLLATYFKYKKRPKTLQVASNGLLEQMLTLDQVIDPYDLKLIRTHLERQNSLLGGGG